jgi:hypothetical protein
MTVSSAHIEALQSFGYTPQEARFLYLVATHSGYFQARQFLAFTCSRQRKRTALFRTKLHANKHARTDYFPGLGVIDHVFGGKLYRHLGRENLRNRREHEVEHIQRRLAMLDFVLSHLELNYLETEPEKCAYFEQTLGIASDHFPSRTYHGHPGSQSTVRYFIDRFPMYVDRPSAPAVVTLSYIQPAEANLNAFVRHLKAYLPLLRELSEFRFLYLARSDSHFDRAREIFDSFVTVPLGSNPADDLLRYFTIRKTWDDRRYSSVTEADLIFRNLAKERFSAPRFEHLYREWEGGRMPDTQVRDQFQSNGKSHTIRFESQLLRAVGPNTKEKKPCQ